jgi:CRP-like cAMP-binding protein
MLPKGILSTMNDLKNFLKTLAPITDQDFEAAQHAFSELHLKKGATFLQQGMVCRQIAYVSKGSLKLFYVNEKAEAITSCFCTPNSLATSYKSFIQQQPSELSIEALENTTLWVIDYDSLQKLYSSSIVWQSLGRAVAEREYFVMEQYASVLNNESAKEKYLRLLREQPEVLQKATVEDIASYLGVSRRTLSRIRQEISR